MQIVEKVVDTNATESDIQQFEGEIGMELPKGYRQFLMLENGGRPQRVRITFQTVEGESNSAVNFFYSLLEGSVYSLRRWYDVFEDRIPSNMIPIANDAFGNQFLLAIGDESGVYFWDHELELEEDVNNVYLVANSFEEFAKMFP